MSFYLLYFLYFLSDRYQTSHNKRKRQQMTAFDSSGTYNVLSQSKGSRKWYPEPADLPQNITVKVSDEFMIGTEVMQNQTEDGMSIGIHSIAMKKTTRTSHSKSDHAQKTLYSNQNIEVREGFHFQHIPSAESIDQYQ